MAKEELFDVIATDIKTGKKRPLAVEKTESNAEAIVKMAVMRRGCDEEYFAAIPATMKMKKQCETATA